MPEKDGDEGKSTKSVVNKKQKQMMGEEGYDIARDMGRVRPSKDKKDATTMPPSKEMKKTQKVNKGPSAFERVKARYGKSVMKVEELDLSKVAEALGGYIVEGKLEAEKKEADAKFRKDFRKSGATGDFSPTMDTKLRKERQAKRDARAKKLGTEDPFTTPTPKEPIKPFGDKPVAGGLPMNTNQTDKPPRIKRIPKDTGSGDPAEIGKNLMKFGQFSQKLEKLRKDVDKSKQGIVDIDTDKFFKQVEKGERKEKGFDNLKKAIRTGTTKSGEDASKIGTRDYSTMNPSERQRAFGTSGSTEGGAGVEGPKNQSGVVKFSSGARGTSPSGSPEMGGESKKFSNRKRGPSGAVVSRRTTDAPPKGSPLNPAISGIDFDKPVNAKVVNQSILKKSAAAYTKLAKDNPALGGVAGIAAYDIGKGILGKVKKYTKAIVKSLNVEKPTKTGRISAGT